MNEIIDFKFKETGQDKLYNFKHSHEDGYEILFVHSGSGNIIIKDKILKLIPGAVYFINCCETHCSIPDRPDEYCRSLIVISSSIVDKTCKLLGSHPLISKLFSENDKMAILPNNALKRETELIFEKMHNALSSENEYISSVFVTCFLNIMHIFSTENNPQFFYQSNIISSVLDYINSHISENILLDDICQACHISRFYLCHTFRKSLGITISDYILSRRISQAKKLLRSTNMSISQIAESCGFSSHSYFSMIFKKETGMSPTKFR